MKIGIFKIVALAVLALSVKVQASPEDRHDNAPNKYHAQPQAQPSGRTAGIDESSRCVSDENGEFGDQSANGVSLKYFYELEYDTNVLPNGITKRVLKTIQNKISNYLLPVLFERACLESRRTLAETLRRRLEAVGISALPDDVIVKGASCTYEPTGAGTSCALAFGQASIFALEGASAEHQGDRAIESIELIMKDGGLDAISPGILQVTYVNGTHVKGIDPSVMNTPTAVENSNDESDEGLPGYAVGLIIVSVVGVVAVAMFLIIRKRQQRARERRAMANPGALAFEELSLDGRSRAI